MSTQTLLAAGFGLIAAAGLASSASAQNLLLAPSFETTSGAPDASGGDVTTVGNPPWSGFNPYVAPFGGFYTASQHRTGAQAGKSFGGPNGGIFQNNVPVVAGLTYEASGYLYNASGDAVTVADATEDVRLTFYDAGGVQIGDGAVSDPFIPAGNTDVYTLRSVQAVAPVGAATAQVLFFLNNPSFGGGAIFVDDASLSVVTTVPEPASLGLLGAGGLLALRRRR